MEAAPHPAVPEQIGNFRVLRELGRGGMGVVYLGERTRDFEQRVAIKILYANALSETNEEEILRSLDHAGIVRYLDCGRLPQGTPYLIMEFIDGEPIDAYCAANNVSQAERIGLLRQAADAVTYAHSRFVTHGDLKPGNLFVTGEGAVKLLDFGIATWLGPSGATTAAAQYTSGFASPEQRLGTRGTVAGDIYALGKTAEAVLSGAPERISPELQAILRKACRHEPEARYRTARDLSLDLEALLQHRPVQAYRHDRFYAPERWVRRNRAVAALLAATVLIVLGATIAIAVQTVRAERGQRAAEARLEELMALTGTLQGELYRSLPAQDTADAARRALLLHVTATLDDLRGESAGDPKLSDALAVQYRTLAHLQAEDGQAAEAQRDLSLSDSLLRHIAGAPTR